MGRPQGSRRRICIPKQTLPVALQRRFPLPQCCRWCSCRTQVLLLSPALPVLLLFHQLEGPACLRLLHLRPRCRFPLFSVLRQRLPARRAPLAAMFRQLCRRHSVP